MCIVRCVNSTRWELPRVEITQFWNYPWSDWLRVGIFLEVNSPGRELSVVGIAKDGNCSQVVFVEIGIFQGANCSGWDLPE